MNDYERYRQRSPNFTVKFKPKGACYECGKPLLNINGKPRKSGKYCSAACRTLFYEKHSWQEICKAIWRRDKGKCRWCGKDLTYKNMYGENVPSSRGNVHHIIPLHLGGTNDHNNLVLLCQAYETLNCHGKAHRIINCHRRIDTGYLRKSTKKLMQASLAFK